MPQRQCLMLLLLLLLLSAMLEEQLPSSQNQWRSAHARASKWDVVDREGSFVCNHRAIFVCVCPIARLHQTGPDTHSSRPGNATVASSDAIRGSLTAYRINMNISHFHNFIIKGQYTKQKIIEHSVQSETQSRKRKIVNLNTTQDQLSSCTPRTKRNELSPACHSTSSAWARTWHLVNGGGRDSHPLR